MALVRDVRHGEVLGARRIIDMAIGASMELRGCSEPEAVRELVLAGRETGLGTERIARALVNVLAQESGGDADPDRVAAVGRWRHLLDARAGTAPRDNPAVVVNDITIRYGGVNDYIRC
jgi:hypothetical protein